MASNFEVLIEEYLKSKKGKQLILELSGEDLNEMADGAAKGAADAAVEEALNNYTPNAVDVEGLEQAVKDCLQEALSDAQIEISLR